RLGLEWAHRLATNPQRLWRRYLLEGPRIFPIYLAWVLRGRRKWWAAGGLLVAALVLAFMLRGSPDFPSGQASEGRATLPAAEAQPLNLPPPDLLRPLSPQEATKENAE